MERESAFRMYNFVPRRGVLDRANHALGLILEKAPSDANCTALIERQGDQFVFEIVLRSVSDVFRAEARIDIKSRQCRSRLWQIGVIQDLRREISTQIHNWHERRLVA